MVLESSPKIFHLAHCRETTASLSGIIFCSQTTKIVRSEEILLFFFGHCSFCCRIHCFRYCCSNCVQLLLVMEPQMKWCVWSCRCPATQVVRAESESARPDNLTGLVSRRHLVCGLSFSLNFRFSEFWSCCQNGGRLSHPGQKLFVQINPAIS